MLIDKCMPKDKAEMKATCEKFVPETEAGQEMWKVLSESMDIDRLIAVEVDHCPQSYACLVESQSFGKIIYSGDTLPC